MWTCGSENRKYSKILQCNIVQEVIDISCLNITLNVVKSISTYPLLEGGEFVQNIQPAGPLFSCFQRNSFVLNNKKDLT